MEASSIPYKFTYAWGAGASAGYITAEIPVSSSGAAASQVFGFPPVTAALLAAGGTPPSIADWNGFGFYTTLWNQWQQAGGPIFYDGTFSANIGGYPKGTLLMATSYDNLWLSTVDNNTSDPDTGGSNWTNFSFSPATQEWRAGTVTSVVGGTVSTNTLTLNWQLGAVTALSGASIVGSTLTVTGSSLFSTVSNVGGSRVSGTTYTNSTGKPMFVMVSTGANPEGAATVMAAFINGTQVFTTGGSAVDDITGVSFIVPAGATYKVVLSGEVSIASWFEIS